jgi:hypothetical protein
VCGEVFIYVKTMLDIVLYVSETGYVDDNHVALCRQFTYDVAI